MTFQPFGYICPEIAKSETWRYTLPKAQHGLPAGHYCFPEFYCTETGCDCRRVWLVIKHFSKWPPGNAAGKHIATIGYGWEKPEFYMDWSPGDPDAAELAGARVEPLQPQSEYAEAALLMTKSVIFSSLGNILRIRQHYDAFRASLPWNL